MKPVFNFIEMKLTFTYFTIFLIIVHLKLQSQSLEQKIDSLLGTTYNSHEPGAVFLAAKKGTVFYSKALGVSNLELKTPISVNNVFEIGSMTKQFTAVAVLILEEKGKLSVHDELTKYIPSYPTHGQKITLHHLLTHTSGIKNFTNMKQLNSIAQKEMTPLELIDFFKNEPMDFNPGEQFRYSNSGYVLLGYVIEKVSGMSYADFIEQYIFKPIKMNASYYANHHTIIPNRAYGYLKNNTFINKKYISYSIPYASGSLMSTVNDLFAWQLAIKNNLLISKKSTQKVFTNYTLNNGDFINYGYGWHVKTDNQHLVYEHGGSIFGFKSMGVYLPELDIYVVGLTNCSCNSPTIITRQIATLISESITD